MYYVHGDSDIYHVQEPPNDIIFIPRFISLKYDLYLLRDKIYAIKLGTKHI